ncbi:MAG: co-chaperone GroES, partial [Elusimicrobia bacterium]|nr:co-chaperone GroES [Elusimicrobiota bacterium]
PDTAKEKPQEGEIVAAGKGKVSDEGKLLPMDVKAGDRVLYGKYSGTEVKIDNVDHLVCHQEDILGILE